MKRPGILPSSPAFKRNVSLFLFVALVFIAFFGVYWYKYIPGNRDELNERGFRTLRQLSGNIVTKYDGLQQDLVNIYRIYGDSGHCDGMNKYFLPSFIRYVVEKIGYDTDTGKCAIPYPSDRMGRTNAQVTECNGDYHFSFGVPAYGHIFLRTDKFLKNVLAARNDLFESYLLLLQPQQTETDFRSSFKMSDSAAARSNYEIVYEHTTLSGSDRLNIDSSLRLEKNSDLTSVTTATIAGKSYQLFVQPFRMHNARLALVGLVSEAGYTKSIKSMPVGFASALIIIMIVLLTILPLIKIFFVGPKERISARDVLTINLAIYLGTSFLVLILLYFCVAFVSARAFNTRLQEVSGQISGEFNAEIRRAGEQLNKYDSLFRPSGRFGPEFFSVLQNQSDDPRLLALADSLFIPAIYRNFSRIFWMDEHGGTLIKWNPYDVHVPLTPLKGNPYFDSLLKLTSSEDTGLRRLLVSAGKSNVTAEFQVYISRLSADTIVTACSLSGKAHALTMAAFPNCSNYPILPPAFGFSIIDDANFNVLIHSDPRRNLSENIMDETLENEKLKHAIEYKGRGIIDPVNIYGSDHVFLVTPLQGTGLSLLTYYDKGIIFNNIFRLVHFTAESLLYLFCALALCVIAATGFSNRPGKLRFNLKQVVWVRPSIRNLKSYRFTGAYWSLLFFFTLVSAAVAAIFPGDFVMLFYIVLLLPLYTLWGFVSSRKKASIGRWPEKSLRRNFLVEVTRSGNAIFFFVLLFNFVFWNLIGKESGYDQALHRFLLLLYQAGALLLFYYFYRDAFFWDEEQKGRISGLLTRLHITPRHSNEDFSKMYLVSLCWSVLLISIIPVLGILSYGYQSENIQFLKNKQLSLAAAYQHRVAKVADAITDDYKPAIRKDPGFRLFIDSIKHRYSQYLFSQDTIYPAERGRLPAPGGGMPDGPYTFLLDSLFLVTPGEYSTFSVRDRAADSSWWFSLTPANRLYLNYWQSTGAGTADRLVVATAIDSVLGFEPRRVFWTLLLAAFCLFILYLGAQLLDAVVHRLFLLKYYHNLPDSSDELMELYVSPAIRRYTGIPDMSTEEVIDFFLREREMRNHSIKHREEYILAMTLWLTPSYEKLWATLEPEEQFFLYDFALDGFANYKDAEMLTRLTEKKLLLYENSHFRLFSLSFRNYLLTKKGTPVIDKLKDKYAAPGIWETMRVPTLVLIAVAGIFIFTTQDDLAHKISAVLTSVGALIPLLLKMTGRNSSES